MNKSHYLNRYQKHADFAAGFAEQQMMDRDAGLLESAAFCQEAAAQHAKDAMSFRDLFMAYYRVTAMTMNEARAALIVPAECANNNCVQDGQKRLRETIGLAERLRSGETAAPDYVVAAVAGLQSWIDHHRETEAKRRAGWKA